jgi:hypothetical protein
MFRMTPPCAFEKRQAGARHVVGPLEIDVDHGTEAVRGQILGRADEISRGPVDDDVEASEVAFDGRHRVGHRGRIADVGG